MIVARMFVALAVAVVVLLIKDHAATGADGYMELAWIPTGWSILALITPYGGGWWWLTNMGGRQPSERERVAYEDAIGLLQASSSLPLRLPSLWFVVDEPQPDAAVCGDTLMLSRGLLESEHLAAVLAHELGHLATSDGKLTAAINRLIINPLPKLRQRKERPGSRVILAGSSLLLTVTVFGAVLWLARWMIWFARGGLGLMILAPFWGSYWLTDHTHSFTIGGESSPKSGKPRSVPMVREVAAVLARLGQRERFTGDDDLVFAGAAGGHLDSKEVRAEYKAALARAGLRNLRSHDLRHTFGTRAIEQAESILELKEWMGHANVQTTMRYLHYKSKAGAAQRLTAAFTDEDTATQLTQPANA